MTENLNQKEKCKTCGNGYKSDYWHLSIEYFQCLKTGHSSGNCTNNEEKKGSTSFCSWKHKFTTSKNLAPKTKDKKMNCFFGKVVLKQQLGQALTFSFTIIYQQKPLTTLLFLTLELQMISLPIKT